MAAKKAKTEVTYEVQWKGAVSGVWHPDEQHDKMFPALRSARSEMRGSGVAHRVVRVERTVVAEVKP